MTRLRAAASRVAVLAGIGFALVLASTAPALAGSDDYEQTLDLTFPVEAVAAQEVSGPHGYDNPGFTNDFYQSRSNSCGLHRATDVFAPHDTKVHAAEGGEIIEMPETRPSYGWLITVRGDDGRHYRYIHLGRDDSNRDGAYRADLSRGDRVERGEHIGYVGSSGNASAGNPHLHFEIMDPAVTATPCSHDRLGGYLNPYFSLVDAVERGDVPGREADEGTGAEDAADAGSSEGIEVPDHVVRVAGADRAETSVELAERLAPDGADEVVLAAGDAPAEASVAGPLAAAREAPMLLTGRAELHERVAEALADLDPDRVTLVGGDELLGSAVRDEVADLLPQADTQRLGTNDPFATAAQIAEEVWAETDAEDDAETGARRALLAVGEHDDPDRAWPDALAAGWRGALTGEPVLLVEHEAALPEATAEALADVREATIVGGTAAVSDAIADQAAEALGDADALDRRAGVDRYATGLALADDVLADGLADQDRPWATTGRNYADALGAAPTVADEQGLLLLVDGDAAGSDDAVAEWLDEADLDADEVMVIGGPAAVSDEAAAALGSAAHPE